MPQSDGRFTTTEAERYAVDGYVVRQRAFDPGEVAAIVAECEALVSRLVTDRQARRATFGSYTFDADVKNGVVIKWEGETDLVHGLEPFVHLSPQLERWAHDARFIDPMKDILDCESPALFTEKLNLKRPRGGGANPLHQDYPYWVEVAENPAEVATAMLFLDDADLGNGCLQVIAGSQHRGVWPRSNSDDPFARNELGGELPDGLECVPLEVPAGSVVLFGPLLVHCSEPNRSERERRALLFSYQPPGRPTPLDVFRRNFPRRRAS